MYKICIIWRPWIKIDGATSSVTVKKKHLSVDTWEIEKNIYRFSHNT